MKRALKNWLKNLLTMRGIYARSLDPGQTTNKATQLLLMHKYRELYEQGKVLPFEDVEFRLFSQTGEDGILLYLFSLVGMAGRRAVEICAGDGIQCNAANLIVNHGFTGLLIDGDTDNVRRGKKFYKHHPDTLLYPPTMIQAWITKDNVNQLITDHGFSGELDLFSLDLDGVDYWVWKELSCVSPRVMVVEYNKIWGPEKSVTVPYRADFAEYGRSRCDYNGASLAAFVKLGKEKGYRLVGCQRYGFNAFFLREDTGKDIFPEISPAECFDHPFARAAPGRVNSAMSREWVEV